MSTCSIHNGNIPEKDYSFNEGSHLQESLPSVDGPEILQRTASQNNEELKRARNRLAQRKHRQRKKAEEQGKSVHHRETRSRKLSAANNRAISIQKDTEDGTRQTFSKDTQRYRAGVFTGHQESGSESFANTAVTTISNQGIIPSIIDDLDFSLIEESNDMFNSERDTNLTRSISQYYLSNFAPPYTAPPFFGSKSPSIFEEQFQRQSMSKPMSTNCKCNPQSALSPTHFPPQWSDAGRQNQIPTPQHEVTEERENICYQLTAAEEPRSRTNSNCTNLPCLSLLEHDQQDWQNQGVDSTTVNCPFSRVSIPTQRRLPCEARLPTPIESVSSSSTKSPLLAMQHALPSNQPAPPHAYPHSTIDPNTTTRRTASRDLEKRFERIFDAIEEAGFDSIDSMAACYYTTCFPPNSPCASAQSLSRRRYLRKFLEDIRESARGWDAGESQGYQEGITKSATSVYVDELGSLNNRGWCGTAGAGSVVRADSRKRIRDAVLDDEMVRQLKEEKRLLRERIPENWSLLTELARTAGLSQLEGSQAACMFLCMLGG